mmetsp:Transcript_3345/g.11069  ORF Transcript_3345/g.11069 Transcript_3345/m.11069 type:complete len:303 (-) Transcript_3345:213-1121(-)
MPMTPPSAAQTRGSPVCAGRPAAPRRAPHRASSLSEHGHRVLVPAAGRLPAWVGEPLQVLVEERGRLHVPVPQVHQRLLAKVIVLDVEGGGVVLVVCERRLALRPLRALVDRLDDLLLLGLAFLGARLRLGCTALVVVLARVLRNLLEALRARLVVLCRQRHHRREACSQRLQLAEHKRLDLDAEVVAIADGRRLEDEPQLRLLEVVHRRRRLLARLRVLEVVGLIELHRRGGADGALVRGHRLSRHDRRARHVDRRRRVCGAVQVGEERPLVRARDGHHLVGGALAQVLARLERLLLQQEP